MKVPTSTTLRAPVSPTKSESSTPWSGEICMTEREPVRSLVSATSARFASGTACAATAAAVPPQCHEESDHRHDERSDLAHRFLLSAFLCAPITLEPTPNRSITSG